MNNLLEDKKHFAVPDDDGECVICGGDWDIIVNEECWCNDCYDGHGGCKCKQCRDHAELFNQKEGGGVYKVNIDQAQKEYDNELPDDNFICLRCEEEIAEDGEDYCYICEEIIREQNRDRFIAEETY